MKKFNAYIFSTQDLIELKKINKQIKETFETKQTISPIILQNSIRRVNERLQATWNIFSDSLTHKTHVKEKKIIDIGTVVMKLTENT